MSTSRAFAIKRITKDLKEIQLNPLEGVGICQLDPNDPFQLLVNIRVLQGRYKDLLFHILLFLPEQYPCKPPRMLILPGQPYDNSFHHHIYPEDDGYFKFCIDLLDAAIMNSNAIGSGWSPGYTFCTLLMQIQNFLADPDFHSKAQELSDAQISAIRKKVNEYTYTHNVNGKKVVHSTKTPFPPLQKGKEEKKPDLNSVTKDSIKQRLSCFMTKDNYIDNPEGIYGYPIYVQKDKFNRLQQKPIPEILSYEGFKSQLDQYNLTSVSFNSQFKTGMGEAYNAFIPIFINRLHYQQSKKVLAECLNSISSENRSFELQIIQVLPNLINKMVVALLNNSMHQSISAIEAYVHFTQLFHYLIEDNASLRQEIDQRVKNMIQSDRARSKQELGDIGEFLVVLSASDYALTPKLFNILYREYFARQIFWIPKNAQLFQQFKNKTQIKDKLDVIFTGAIVSNQLLIFNIEAAEKFATRKKYLRQLADERCSVISEQEAEKFIKDANQIIKEVNSHVKLMDYLGLDNVYPEDEDCYELFKIAIYVSNNQKYTNFTLDLVEGKKITPQTLQIKGDFQQPQLTQADLTLKRDQINNVEKKPQTQVKQPEVNKAKQVPIQKEEQKTQSKAFDSSEDDEDDWNTVSDPKNKKDKQTKKVPEPIIYQQPKQQPPQNKVQNNNLTKKAKEPEQQQQSNNSKTQPKQQQKQQDDDDDDWNVVVDKKKK